MAVIGASPGGFGAILSQNAWLPVLRTLGTRPWFDGRLIGFAGEFPYRERHTRELGYACPSRRIPVRIRRVRLALSAS